jgi:EAL domain-containing protein (putative c-di-GMP-specific phosphodiesterase class I)
MPVAVNVSGRQLDGDFVATVHGVLERTGLEPALLELELTESTLMHNIEGTAVILGQLRGLGVRIAIDDFGTGYSALSLLRHLPVDALKIDRTFMCDVVRRADDAAISRGIIALAHSLGLRVVAEGVEQVDQLDFLREERCHAFQGFHFSEPLPADALMQLLNTCRGRTGA